MTIILFYVFFSALFTGGFILRRGAEDKIVAAIITSIVLGWVLMPIILGDLVDKLSEE